MDFDYIFEHEPYLGVRLLADFSEEFIKEIKDSGMYPQLFTPTMENRIYANKIDLLNIPTEMKELILSDRKGKFKPIYRTLEAILNHEERKYVDIILGALSADNALVIELFDEFLGLEALSHYTKEALKRRNINLIFGPITIDNTKIISYFLMSEDSYLVNVGLHVLLSSKDDQLIFDVSKYLTKTAPNYFDSFIRSLAQKRRVDLLKAIIERENLIFNGTEMAALAHEIRDRSFIQYLIDLGSEPVDRDVYRMNFGRLQNPNPDYM
ncbi:MAG: hypothetical protein Solivirus1_51 [Solivirus sp.]|uniref:Uncharacterized protein n=1 Tax=Solivirus sp. TaxID=2487772 RepID=A0A3G5AH26_9VIRU|nr:MAG: hypothetical protein Solivirus1_51 [Solivirus sp.]